VRPNQVGAKAECIEGREGGARVMGSVWAGVNGGWRGG
jgi:hypothetical protein